MWTTHVLPSQMLPSPHTCKATIIATAYGIQLLDQYGGLRNLDGRTLFESANTHSPKELLKAMTNTIAVTREGE